MVVPLAGRNARPRCLGAESVMQRVIVALGVLWLILFGCYRTLIGGQTISWHQRLTVIVDTPNGEVSGSAVTEVTKTDTSGPLVLPQASGVHGEIRGEAVVVEVLPGRWLFALLSGGDNYKGDTGQLVYSAFRLGEGRTASEQSYEANMADVLAQPLDTPVPVPPEAYPMLVTFDDITKPETVREVDPDDLDAAFGCERGGGALRFPWREAGLTYRKWAEGEVTRLSREMASERSGVVGPAGDALTETYFITDDHSYTKADELRLKELREQITERQRIKWNEARWALIEELPATLPNPQTVTAKSGGPCYELKAVTLEITREGVTEGRVEEVLDWLRIIWPNGLDGQRYETSEADNRLANSLASGSFSTEIRK
jgi:hypothetical protein